MNINGMTNKVDVINSIIDNIDDAVNMDDDGNLDTAKDSLNQLKEIEENEAEAHNPKGKYKYVDDKLVYEEKINEQMQLLLEEPLDQKLDLMLELENEMTVGK